MSRIPTRLRAFAMTSLALVVLMTGVEATFAATPRVGSDPTASAAVAPTTTPDASAPTPDASTPITDAPTASAGASTTDASTTTGAATPAATPAAATSANTTSPSPSPMAEVPVAAVVVAFARSHLRAAYRHFGTGPSSFDCSGLMWRVFTEAGLGRKVTSRSARGIYLSYRARGLASRANPQPGDLIVWGRGSHVGVYIGRGYAISALVQGVRVHRVHAMFTPFTAYLHTHLTNVQVPAWELTLAQHAKVGRHAIHSTTLRASPGSSSASLGRIHAGLRFVVLGRQRDPAGRLWLKVMTFRGWMGWLPARVTAR